MSLSEMIILQKSLLKKISRTEFLTPIIQRIPPTSSQRGQRIIDNDVHPNWCLLQQNYDKIALGCL